MAAQKQSERDFQAMLATRLKESIAGSATNVGVGVNSKMVMHKPPVGTSKSLSEIFDTPDASEQLAADLPADAASTAGSNVDMPRPATGQFSYVIEQIPLALIDDSPYQPRVGYDETAIQTLGALLAADGQNDAIIVRKMPNERFQLISGHRRTRAAKLIGWTEIAARIVSKDEFQTKATAYFSNEGAVHLSEFEKALMYRAALEEGIVSSQSDLVVRTGLSKGRISQIMSLLKLPEAFQNLLNSYPYLFGYAIGDEIRKLLVQFPNGQDTILEGVQRLIDNPDLAAKDIREFVIRKLSVKKPVTQKPQVVTSQSGKEYFAVSATEKRLVIDFKEPLDNSALGKRMLAFLREFADIADADAGKIKK